jgi:hypothetical protein
MSVGLVSPRFRWLVVAMVASIVLLNHHEFGTLYFNTLFDMYVWQQFVDQGETWSYKFTYPRVS